MKLNRLYVRLLDFKLSSLKSSLLTLKAATDASKQIRFLCFSVSTIYLGEYHLTSKCVFLCVRMVARILCNPGDQKLVDRFLS